MRNPSQLPRHWIAGVILLLAGLVIGLSFFVPYARRTIEENMRRAAQPLSDPGHMHPVRSAAQRHWHRVWTWPSGAPLSGAPMPLGEGWVAATQDGRILALNANGRPLWTALCSNLVFNGAVAVADSNVVVTTGGGAVVAVNAATGSQAWQVTLDGTLRHGPLAMRRGNDWQIVLLSSGDGVLHALDAKTGHLLWHAEATGRSDGPPAADRRHIALGNCDAALHLFDGVSGASLAHIPVGTDAQMAGGVLLQDARAYAGTRAGMLVCFDLDATRLSWSAAVTDGETFVTPVSAGPAVMTGAPDGTVAAFDAASGSPVWKVSVSNAVTALCEHDDALFLAAGGSLIGLRNADGSRFATLAVGDNVLGPVCNDRGIITVADDGGNIIAVAGE